MDIVYPVKMSFRHNIELKYSLRSLQNLPHDKVYIIGHRPPRIQNVEYIPYVDRKIGRKYRNVYEKIQIVLNDPRISEDFVWMNDDFFIMNPIEKIENMYNGKLQDFVDKKIAEIGQTRRVDTMVRVLRYFPDALNYELHSPCVFNKEKMRKMDKYPIDYGAIRSFYFNRRKELAKPYKDYKCFNPNDLYKTEGQTFISSDNNLSRYQEFIDYMESKFPEKSIYEI